MPGYIIGGKRYALEKRNLLCEATISRPDVLVDLRSKTIRLYCTQGKAFIVDVIHDLTGQHEPPRVITREEAMKIMNTHPDGIKEREYIRHIGRPEDA